MIRHFGNYVSDIVLASIFFVLFAISCIQLVRNQLYSVELGWTQRKLFHGLILFSNLFRVVFFALQIPFRENIIKLTTGLQDLNFLLNVLPGILYFSTFILLVFFWAEFYYFAHDKTVPSLQRLRPLFLWGNAIIYSIVTLMLIVLFVLPEKEKLSVKISVVIFLALLSAVGSISFLVFGGRLLMVFKRFPISSRRRKTLLSKVGWVTVVCSLDFLTRAVIIVWSALNLTTRLDYRFTVSYYVVLEIVPLALMMWLLRKIPKSAAAAMADQDKRDRAPLISEHS